jgi:hypothetical protein
MRKAYWCFLLVSNSPRSEGEVLMLLLRERREARELAGR